MADAAKSDEIEDVLSSIRRLVSEHQPAARSDPPAARDRAPATPAEAPVEAASGQRLLLTPALRVTDPEDPWVPITPRAPDDAPTAEDDSPPAHIARADGADWAQELWEGDDDQPPATEDAAADPQLQADQWEAGNPEPEDTPGPAEEAGLTDPVDVTEALLAEVVEAASEEAEDSLDAEGDDSYPDAPLSFIRSTKSVGDYEPEENNDALSGGDLPSPMRELAEARAAHSDSGALSTPPRVKVEIVRSSVADDMAAPQETAAETAPEREDQADDASGSALQDEHTDSDAVADFLASELEDNAVEDLGEAPFTFPDDGDGFVDEEALRDIIAEVVREELQGEMGVRITRNVRKLVRREIRLALAAQDIE